MPHVSSLAADRIRDKSFIVLTDITPNEGMSGPAMRTVRHLVGAGAQSVGIIPSRLAVQAAITVPSPMLAALTGWLVAQLSSDKVTLITTTAADAAARKQLMSTAAVFVNDAFPTHPVALEFDNKKKEEVQAADEDNGEGIRGYAFALTERQVWPLKNKTAVILTDAETPLERSLALQTIANLTGVARSVVVVTTTATTGQSIAQELHVTLEGSLPTRSFGALWQRPVSVVAIKPEENGGAVTTDMRQCVAAAHLFVNDCKSSNTALSSVAAESARHAAIGVLREAAMSVGPFATSPLHEGQERIERVWPVKFKRFVFLVDRAVVDGARSSNNAAKVLTWKAVNTICERGGVVILVPASEAGNESNSGSGGFTSNTITQLAPAASSSSSLYLPSLPASETIAVKQEPPGTVIVLGTCPAAGSVEADHLLDSSTCCDVFVRDFTAIFTPASVLSTAADSLLKTARSKLGHVAIGAACMQLNVDLTPSTPIALAGFDGIASLSDLPENHFLRVTADRRRRGAAGGDAAGGGAGGGLFDFMTDSEANEMRKPIDGGEGSLMSNVVASLATTILLHPLQLYLYPVPDPRHLWVGRGSYLGLRCVHSVARDAVFHLLSKKGPRFPGFMSSGSAGLLSEPLRAIAHGVQPRSAVCASLLDPGAAATALLVNMAPQMSFRLSTALFKSTRRFVRIKIQLSTIMGAIARALVCLVLCRLLQNRRYVGQSGSAVKVTDPKIWALLYILREVLSLVIETVVQKYFR